MQFIDFEIVVNYTGWKYIVGNTVFSFSLEWHMVVEMVVILLPKLFGSTMRKNCSSDREKNQNSKLKVNNLQNFWDH